MFIPKSFCQSIFFTAYFFKVCFSKVIFVKVATGHTCSSRPRDCEGNFQIRLCIPKFFFIVYFSRVFSFKMYFPKKLSKCSHATHPPPFQLIVWIILDFTFQLSVIVCYKMMIRLSYRFTKKMKWKWQILLLYSTDYDFIL